MKNCVMSKAQGPEGIDFIILILPVHRPPLFLGGGAYFQVAR